MSTLLVPSSLNLESLDRLTNSLSDDLLTRWSVNRAEENGWDPDDEDDMCPGPRVFFQILSDVRTNGFENGESAHEFMYCLLRQDGFDEKRQLSDSLDGRTLEILLDELSTFGLQQSTLDEMRLLLRGRRVDGSPRDFGDFPSFSLFTKSDAIKFGQKLKMEFDATKAQKVYHQYLLERKKNKSPRDMRKEQLAYINEAIDGLCEVLETPLDDGWGLCFIWV